MVPSALIEIKVIRPRTRERDVSRNRGSLRRLRPIGLGFVDHVPLVQALAADVCDDAPLPFQCHDTSVTVAGRAVRAGWARRAVGTSRWRGRLFAGLPTRSVRRGPGRSDAAATEHRASHCVRVSVAFSFYETPSENRVSVAAKLVQRTVETVRKSRKCPTSLQISNVNCGRSRLN
jgi:hypothetical protein